MESNFIFFTLDQDWQELFDRSHKSEKYAKSDERASFVYSRMALELIIDYIYEYEDLKKQSNSLFDKTKSAKFSSLITHDLRLKIEAIRQNGNKAVHNSIVAEVQTVKIVKYLFDLSKWFFSSYSEVNDEIQDEFNSEILNKHSNLQTISRKELSDLENKLRQENFTIISKYKERISALEQSVIEKDLALQKYESIISTIENNYKLLQHEIENQQTAYKIISIGITEQIGKIWGRVFINLLIDEKPYYAVKFFSPNHLGRATERFLIDSGKYQNSELYQLFPNTKENLLKKDVISGNYDNLNLVLNFNKNRFGTPSILLKKLLENINNSLNINNLKSKEKNAEFEQINNFSNYYSAGAIEHGIHGPEIINSKLYISIYHYLEYLGMSPRDYNTFSLGSYLTSQSGSDYKTCKYKNQSFTINKFNIDLLKKERNIFDNYKK